MIGSIRGVAQTISYEIRIALVIIVVIMLLASFKVGIIKAMIDKIAHLLAADRLLR